MTDPPMEPRAGTASWLETGPDLAPEAVLKVREGSAGFHPGVTQRL